MKLKEFFRSLQFWKPKPIPRADVAEIYPPLELIFETRIRGELARAIFSIRGDYPINGTLHEAFAYAAREFDNLDGTADADRLIVLRRPHFSRNYERT